MAIRFWKTTLVHPCHLRNWETEAWPANQEQGHSQTPSLLSSKAHSFRKTSLRFRLPGQSEMVPLVTGPEGAASSLSPG